MSKLVGIYAIENTVSGNLYVGSSKDIERRFKKHKSELHLNRHHSPHLQFAWNKYGEDVFRFIVLIQCHPDMLVYYEQQFLDAWKPEYNVNPRANRPMVGGKRSEETKRKISKAHASPAWQAWNASRKGKDIRSPEHVAKMLAAHHKVVTPSVNAKRSATQKGTTRTDEFKAKVSAGQKARYARASITI